MPQHVRVSLEAKLCGLSHPFHHPRKAGGAEGRAALGGENEGGSWILPRCSRRAVQIGVSITVYLSQWQRLVAHRRRLK